MSLAATLAVWPVLSASFAVVAPAGPLATLLAAPALPFVILLSLAAALAGLVFPPLAQLVGWAAWLFVSYMLAVARVFSRLPVLNVSAGVSVLLGYYALFCLVLWQLARHRRRRLSAELSLNGEHAGENPPSSPFAKGGDSKEFCR